MYKEMYVSDLKKHIRVDFATRSVLSQDNSYKILNSHCAYTKSNMTMVIIILSICVFNLYSQKNVYIYVCNV